MKIRRSRPAADFTIIPNAALRDDRLSYCARDVLVELLSRPDGWETNADALSERARRHRGSGRGEGRRAMRAAFAELEAIGYMIRHREQAAGGRFVTVLEVHDTPQDRGTANGTSADGTSVHGTSVSGTSSVRTEDGITDEEDVAGEHSASLAAAREGPVHARERDRLERVWGAVDQLPDGDLRNLLLSFERKRPRIYRDCRQAAIGQLEREKPHVLKTKSAGRAIDSLSFKYALQHYAPDWPAWLTKFPLRAVS